MALQASALHAALETAEFLLSGRQDKLVVGDGTAPGAAASQDAADLYEALASLAEEAKSMLNEEAREQVQVQIFISFPAFKDQEC